MPRRRPPAPPEPLTTAELLAEVRQRPDVQAVVRFTRNEVRAQLSWVEDLVVQGASMSQIERVTLARFPQVTKKRIRSLVERVKEAHAREDNEARAEWKSAQIRRLHTYRTQASGQRTPDGRGWLTPPDHKAIIAYERLLAQVCGTLEPVTMNVNATYTEALLQVTANLMVDPDRAMAVLEEAQEQARRADLAKRFLPPAILESGTETDSAESVPTSSAAE
jgi:hypothetical protein